MHTASHCTFRQGCYPATCLVAHLTPGLCRCLHRTAAQGRTFSRSQPTAHSPVGCVPLSRQPTAQCCVCDSCHTCEHMCCRKQAILPSAATPSVPPVRRRVPGARGQLRCGPSAGCGGQCGAGCRCGAAPHTQHALALHALSGCQCVIMHMQHVAGRWQGLFLLHAACGRLPCRRADEWLASNLGEDTFPTSHTHGPCSSATANTGSPLHLQ